MAGEDRDTGTLRDGVPPPPEGGTRPHVPVSRYARGEVERREDRREGTTHKSPGVERGGPRDLNALIDLAGIAERADLRSLVEAELGAPDRAGRWCCPFHAEETPSFGITPDRRHFKCFGCGASGDALDWVRQRDGVDVVEAARRLEPEGVPGRARRDGDRPVAASKSLTPSRPPQPEPPAAWQDAEWQDKVAAITRFARSQLWSDAGGAALDWLRRRGLRDRAIRQHWLGFVPDGGWSSPLGCLTGRRGQPGKIQVPRGIAIPWPHPTLPGYVGLNVRRLADPVDDPLPAGVEKYRAMRGSTRGYVYPEQPRGRPALVVEGEFDALLAVQEVGHLLDVVTVGSASVRRLPRPTRAALARSPWLLIATDHDRAGVEAARAWRELYPHKARRVLLPKGKDFGEFITGGGDAAGWIAAELARLDCIVAGRRSPAASPPLPPPPGPPATPPPASAVAGEARPLVMGDRVATPLGPGRVVHPHGGRVVVVLDRDDVRGGRSHTFFERRDVAAVVESPQIRPEYPTLARDPAPPGS
jgi:hypothetical protein